MKSIPLLIAIFGGVLALCSIINAARLTYYDTAAHYRSSWGMTADWFTAARKEGWLRSGRKSNLWSALIGAVLFSSGMYVWGWSPLSPRGQDFLLFVSVLVLIAGVAGRGVEDGYSVNFKTLRWTGVIGTLTSITMIFGT